MANSVEDAPATELPADAVTQEWAGNDKDERGRARASSVETKSALELVAMRGRDVIGVRHLLEGGRAFLGSGPEAIARMPTKDLGGGSVVVGEVTASEF